jgi:hypothetical protein
LDETRLAVGPIRVPVSGPCPMQPRDAGIRVLGPHSRSRLRIVLGGDGVKDRAELKGFLIPQKQTHSLNPGHVGLLADRHWRTCTPTLPWGFQWVNALRAWTVDRVIAELPWLGPLDQHEALDALSGQRDELSQALRRALQTCGRRSLMRLSCC